MTTLNLATILQSLTSAAEKLKPQEVEAVLNKKAYLDIRVIAYKEAANPKKTVLVDFLKINDELSHLENRESATTYLKNINKIELQEFAKSLSLAVDSSTNKEKLIDKIVERKVGLRLRQNAFSEVMRSA